MAGRINDGERITLARTNRTSALQAWHYFLIFSRPGSFPSFVDLFLTFDIFDLRHRSKQSQHNRRKLILLTFAQGLWLQCYFCGSASNRIQKDQKVSESIELKTWNNVDPKDSTAETVKDVRVLVSFYVAWGDVNVNNDPVHKEKFCVPVSGTQIFIRSSERPKRIQKPCYILYWNKDSCRTEEYWAKLFHNYCPCIKK